MRSRRHLIAVPALAVTLIAAPLTACGTDSGETSASSSTVSTTPLNPFEQQRYDGVTALLDQLSSTLTSGDRGGLGALIDDAASPEFRRRMEAIAADFAGPAEPINGSGPLKLKEFRYRVAPQGGPEHLLDEKFVAQLEEAGATDTWVTPVYLDYALGGASSPGLDEPTVTLNESLTFARYGDDWKVVGAGALAPDPTPETVLQANPKAPEMGPWEFPGLAATDVSTSGGTSTVLFYRGSQKAATTASRILPAAVTEVTKFWGDDWARKAAIIATATDEQFAGLTRTEPGGTSAAAAATVFALVDKQNGQVVGQRIVLTPAARSLPAASLAVVLRHELVHVAARLVTAENVPLWLTEGVPEYVGRKGTYREFVDAAPELAAAVTAGEVPKALPSDGSFSVDSDDARLAYQTAWSFATFVADEFGEAKLKDMYVNVAKGGDTATTDSAIKDALGVDKAAVVADWQTWLKKQAR